MKTIVALLSPWGDPCPTEQVIPERIAQMLIGNEEQTQDDGRNGEDFAFQLYLLLDESIFHIITNKKTRGNLL